MRIISGKHRGKVLSEFVGKDIRPTSDRAREALFNILQFRINGSIFLDAFCGSGSVGIEALSRGAKQVVFCDNSQASIDLTKKNLASCKEQGQVFFGDAVEFLKSTSIKFDLVFIDPPYASLKGIEVLQVICDRKLLAKEGIAIYEHKVGENRKFDGLELYSTRKYGIAECDFYREKL